MKMTDLVGLLGSSKAPLPSCLFILAVFFQPWGVDVHTSAEWVPHGEGLLGQAASIEVAYLRLIKEM